MVVFLLVGFVFFIGSFLYYRSPYNVRDGWGDSFGWGHIVLLTMVGLLAGLVISIIAGDTARTEKTNTHKVALVSLTSTASIKGQSYLLGGYIGEEQVYYYSVKDSKGVIRPKSLPAGKVEIVEDENGPYLEEQRRTIEADSFWVKHGVFVIGAGETDVQRYTFHLPKGSIDMTIDTTIKK